MPIAAKVTMLAGALWAVVYFTLPTGVFSEAFWTVGATGIAIALGIAVMRMPAPRSGWVLVALALSCTVAGDYAWAYHYVIGMPDAFPTFADALYLANYPLMAIGLTQLARSGRGQLRLQPTIDGLILSAAAGLAVWIFFVTPVLADGSEPLVARVVGAAYPVADLLLLVTCTQLLVHRLRPSPALWFLLTAIGANLLADIGYLYLETYAEYNPGGLVDLLWWVAYLSLFAAAAHPSARTIVGGTDADASADLRASRLILLTIAAIAAPVLHAVLYALGDDEHTATLIVGTCALFALVISRLWLVARDLEHSRADLRYRATHDELTGVANRALFNERLYAAERSSERGGAVLLIDVDDFKAINDTFGHSAGDAILQAIARRLLSVVPAGSLVARIGGDEFAVLLTTGVDGLNDIATRVVESVREPVTVGLHDLRTSISCGGAVLQGGQHVLRQADEALYAAKRAGRDCHVVVAGPVEDADARTAAALTS